MPIKTIFGALVVAAGVGAALAVKLVKDNKNKEDEEADDEIHFIKIDDEDEMPKFDLSNRSDEVKEVCGVYPYLDPDFVEKILGQNTEFNEKYEKDTLVNVTHFVHFKDAASREGFETIMGANGYVCNQMGETEVTAAKKLFTEDGAIISDILNVANQAAALGGTYEKYDVF